MAIRNSDGSIILTTQVDQTGLRRGMSSMQSEVKRLTNGFLKVGAAIGVAFSIKAIVNFSSEASKMAVKTEASVQRLIDIYGEASESLGKFIDANAHAIGMSKSAATEFSSVYGNLFSVWADQATNANLTTQYLNMTAVVASKTGRTMEDVQERIRSGLLGNTEAIEDLGIFVNVKTIEMTEAFKRVANGRSWEQLNAYEQNQVRTLAILEQATDKYGNTVAENNAMTQARYNAAFEDFKNTWGTVVNYVLMPILKVLTQVFRFATMALQALAGISGKTIDVDTSSLAEQEQSIGGAVNNQNELTDAVKNTAKEQKKLLAGFDEIQVLSSATSSGGSSDSSGGMGANVLLPETTISDSTPIIDTAQFENLKNILESIANMFLSGFWDGFINPDFSSINSSLTEIKKSFTDIFFNTDVQTSMNKFVSSSTKTLGTITGATISIAKTSMENFFAALNGYLTTNAPFITKSIANIFDASSGIATAVGNMWSAFANVFSVFSSEKGVALTQSIITLFSNTYLSVFELSRKLGQDLINLIITPFVNNQELFKTAFDGLLGIIGTFSTTIQSLFGALFEGIILLYDEHISPFIQSITEGITEIVGTFMAAFNEYILPVFQEFANNFAVVVEEHIKPVIDKLLSFIGSIVDFVKDLWENWLQPLVIWLIETLVPIFSEVFGIIGTLINDVFGAIFDVLGGFIDFLTGIFTGDMDKAWQGITGIWEGLVGVFSAIWEGIKSVFGVVADFFLDVFSTAWEGIIGVFSVAGDIFNDIVDGVVSVFKMIVNGLIDGINWVIAKPFEGFNGILDTIQGIDILGVKPFDWLSWRCPVPQIPHLAQGAVIPGGREFVAVLGDQPAGQTNIEAPLDTIVEAFNIALSQNGNGVPSREEHYYLDKTELMSIVYKLFKGGERIAGESLVTGG